MNYEAIILLLKILLLKKLRARQLQSSSSECTAQRQVTAGLAAEQEQSRSKEQEQTRSKAGAKQSSQRRRRTLCIDNDIFNHQQRGRGREQVCRWNTKGLKHTSINTVHRTSTQQRAHDQSRQTNPFCTSATL